MADASSDDTVTAEWVKKELAPSYREYLRLVNEESPKDPESEPYRSLYSAREQLMSMKNKLENHCSDDIRGDEYISLCVSIHSQLGVSYMSTDETSSGQAEYEKVLELAKGVTCQEKVAVSMVTALNGLGILWCNRSGENEKSLELLLRAKTIHQSHCSPPPLAEQDWLLGETRAAGEREAHFEDLHTHTLFYLAQIYSLLDRPKLSAEYCQNTLSRQLETRSYDPFEWSLNAATLSQYYINTSNFPQARHCLAAATVVLHRHSDEVGGQDVDADLREKLDQTAADISRCWIKYCILLLQESSEDERDGTGTREKFEIVHRFEPLELSDIEGQVQCDWIEEYGTASHVFLFGQRHVENAKVFFSLEDRASDHVAIVQDHSRLFKLLSAFEQDLSLKCRMHKRRTDMLSSVLSQLNPQYYLVLNRQLMFELADIYSEMSNHKIVMATASVDESPSLHQVNKINSLIRNAIKHYGNYFSSFDEPVDSLYLSTYLTSKLNISRLYAKLLGFGPAEQIAHLQTAVQGYQWLIDYCSGRAEDIRGVFEEQLVLCREMVELLPQKIELIKAQISS